MKKNQKIIYSADNPFICCVVFYQEKKESEKMQRPMLVTPQALKSSKRCSKD